MRVLPFFLITAAALLGACSKPEPPPEPVRAVRTVEVTGAPAGVVLEFAGEVRARTESRLGFRVAGKVVERPAGLGERVRAGQILARLDPQDLRLGQEAAQAALAAARATLEQTQADHRRFRELREQGFISAAEMERRDTALRSAQAQHRQALAQAQAQGNQADYSVLRADVSGVVTAVEAEPGMVVAAGTPIVRLAHDGPRQVWFSVPEDKVELLRRLHAQRGALEVRLWSDRDGALPAQVEEVAAAADPATRTYLVKASLGRAPVPLGQTATVRLAVPIAAQAVKLPLAAVFEQQGRSTVWVYDPASSTVRAVPVDVAGAEGNAVLISRGLEPGQRVVVAGVHALSAGQKVKLLASTAATTAAAVAGAPGPGVPAAAGQ